MPAARPCRTDDTSIVAAAIPAIRATCNGTPVTPVGAAIRFDVGRLAVGAQPDADRPVCRRIEQRRTGRAVPVEHRRAREPVTVTVARGEQRIAGTDGLDKGR